MKLEIEDIKTIDIKPGQTLVVYVKTENTTGLRAKKRMDTIGNVMRDALADKSVKIVVVPAEHYQFAVINCDEEETHEVEVIGQFEEQVEQIVKNYHVKCFDDALGVVG